MNEHVCHASTEMAAGRDVRGREWEAQGTQSGSALLAGKEQDRKCEIRLDISAAAKYCSPLCTK